jgi:hypothetical protein
MDLPQKILYNITSKKHIPSAKSSVKEDTHALTAPEQPDAWAP